MNKEKICSIANMFLDGKIDKSVEGYTLHENRVKVLHYLINNSRFISYYPRLQPLLCLFKRKNLRSLFSSRGLIVEDNLSVAKSHALRKVRCLLEHTQKDYAEKTKMLIEVEERISSLRREIDSFTSVRLRG
jgi:hypothetical protein